MVMLVCDVGVLSHTLKRCSETTELQTINTVSNNSIKGPKLFATFSLKLCIPPCVFLYFLSNFNLYFVKLSNKAAF